MIPGNCSPHTRAVCNDNAITQYQHEITQFSEGTSKPLNEVARLLL